MNIIDISKEEWKEKFADLPSINENEVIALIKEKGSVDSRKIPFLKLNGLCFDKPIIIKNCLIEGVYAKGTSFHDKVLFLNCLFTGQVEMSAWREGQEFTPTTFAQGFKVKHCRFEDTFTLRNGKLQGEVSFYNCDIEKSLCLDKSDFTGNVIFMGPGKMSALSAYRARFNGQLAFEYIELAGAEKNSIDLNGARVARLSLVDTHLKQMMQLKRARLGEDGNVAWTATASSFHEIDIKEAIFFGTVSLSESQCKGKFDAELPKSDHGQKVGKPVKFIHDLSFEKVEFQDSCNFHGARFHKYATFKDCLFAKGGTFNQADFAQVTSFWQSQSLKALHFRKANFGGVANFGNTSFGAKSSFNAANFADRATFFDAKADGDIFFTGAHFESDFILRKLQCKGGLVLQKITVDGLLNIAGGIIDDRLIMSESTLNSGMETSPLSIGTWASLDSCLINGHVDLIAVKVGVKLSETKETRQDVVPGTFYLSNAIFRQSLELSNARIKGDLRLESTNSYAEIEANQIQVGGDIHLSDSYFRNMMRFSNAQCREIISCKARFKEEVSFNGIQCENVTLKESSFDGGFTMRSMQVAGQINLNRVDVDGKIDLFNCQADRIFFHHLLADHFLIDREIIGDMLSSEQMSNYRQAKNEYGILKQAFQVQSRYLDMDWAYYRFCRANRKCKKVSWRRPLQSIGTFFDWLLLDLGFGYGTRPMNIAGVTLAVICLFAAVYYCVPGGLTDSSGNALEYVGILDAVYLSVTTFASMDYGDCVPYFQHWLKYLFSLEGLLGIFLTTLFVATISRKIIRT